MNKPIPYTLESHPLHMAVYRLCLQIEKLPPSVECTNAVVMASALQEPIAQLLKEHAKLVANSSDFFVHAFEMIKAGDRLIDEKRHLRDRMMELESKAGIANAAAASHQRKLIDAEALLGAERASHLGYIKALEAERVAAQQRIAELDAQAVKDALSSGSTHHTQMVKLQDALTTSPRSGRSSIWLVKSGGVMSTPAG